MCLNARMFVSVLLLACTHVRMFVSLLVCIFTYLHIFLLSVCGKEWDKGREYENIHMCVCVCVCMYKNLL